MIQTFQNKVFRSTVVSAPWYVRNDGIHRNLKIPIVIDKIKRFAAKYEQRLYHHHHMQGLKQGWFIPVSNR